MLLQEKEVMGGTEGGVADPIAGAAALLILMGPGEALRTEDRVTAASVMAHAAEALLAQEPLQAVGVVGVDPEAKPLYH